MISLFTYSLSWWKREWLRIMLSAVGVALGVGVFLATLIAHHSVEQSFRSALESFGGGGWWEFSAEGGAINEQLVPKLAGVIPPHRIAAGLAVPANIRCADGSSAQATLLGLDALAVPSLYQTPQGGTISSSVVIDLMRTEGAVLASAAVASCESPVVAVHGVAKELKPLATVIPLGSGRHQALATSEVEIISDISWAQEWGAAEGVLTVLQVKPTSPDELVALKQIADEERLSFREIEQRADTLTNISKAFRINLLFLSACSLVVAAYLVHSLLSFWCLTRKDDARVLRSIGVSPSQLALLLRLEAVMLSVVGAVGGVVLGRLAAGAMSSVIRETVTALYMEVPQAQVYFEWWLALLGVGLGVALGLIGAWGPSARFASEGVASLRSSAQELMEIDKPVGRSLWTISGLVSIGAAVLSTVLLRSGNQLLLGLVPPLLYLLGVVCLTRPILTWWFQCRNASAQESATGMKLFSPLEDPVALLAYEHLRATFSRTVGAVTAIVVAAGLFVSIHVMIGSFSNSLSEWLNHILKADIFLAIDDASADGAAELPTALVDQARRLPEVRTVDTVAALPATYNGRPFVLRGVDFEVIRSEERLVWRSGGASATDDTFYVSEPFARWHNLRVGDSLELFGKSEFEPLSGVIAGIFTDYSTEFGVVLTSVARFEALPAAPGIRGISVYLKQGIDESKVIKTLSDFSWPGQVVVRSQKELREEVFRIFNATFRVTHVLMWVTLLVSVFVVVTTVAVMVIERRVELNGLRALGASRKQLAAMVGYEARLLGVWGVLGACANGLGLSLILVYFVNPYFFGWSLAPSVDWWLLVILLCVVPFLTWAIGRRVSSAILQGNIEGIRYE